MQAPSNWWQRFIHAPRGIQIGMVLGAGLLSCVVCSCVTVGGLAALGSALPALPTSTGGAAAAAIASATPAISATSTTATAPQPAASTIPTSTVPHVTATATATPKPPIVIGATLGGPDSAFQSKYGQAPDNLWDSDGVTFSTNLDTGVDEQQHVFGMLVYKSDATTWTQTQAESVCHAFLPPDAIYQKLLHDSQGNLEQVYTSKRLSATFPATSQVGYDPLGTVSIDYEVANGGVFQCSINNFA